MLATNASPGEIELALDLLEEHTINVDFLANVPAAEHYRFLVEQLMDHEIEDIHLPGWTTNSILIMRNFLYHSIPCLMAKSSIRNERPCG